MYKRQSYALFVSLQVAFRPGAVDLPAGQLVANTNAITISDKDMAFSIELPMIMDFDRFDFEYVVLCALSLLCALRYEHPMPETTHACCEPLVSNDCLPPLFKKWLDREYIEGYRTLHISPAVVLLIDVTANANCRLEEPRGITAHDDDITLRDRDHLGISLAGDMHGLDDMEIELGRDAMMGEEAFRPGVW